MKMTLLQKLLSFWVLLMVSLTVACSGDSAGGESHWGKQALQACEATRECADGLACQCGICTVTCSDSDDCSTTGGGGVCAEAEQLSDQCQTSLGWASSICVAECTNDDQCSAIDNQLICSTSGVCERAGSGFNVREEDPDMGVDPDMVVDLTDMGTDAFIDMSPSLNEGRIRVETDEDGSERYLSDGCYIPMDEEAGWEAAVFHHFNVIATSLSIKLRQMNLMTLPADVVGGSTYSMDIWDGWPTKHSGSCAKHVSERAS